MAVAAVVLAVVALAAVVALVVSRRSLRETERRAGSLASELAAARAEVDAARADRAAGDALVHALWSLDLLRVGREWAASVATASDGDDEPVAVETAAELATALRLTLERQREETGVPGALVASELGDVPIGPALTVLRVVEEVLASVSRPSEGVAVRLAGGADGDVVVTVTLDATDADVPVVVRGLATAAGASIVVDGPTVTLRVPV